MEIEKAIFRPSVEHANPRGVCGFFAEVFAALDAKPRLVEVEIDFSEAFIDTPIAVDFEKGEPVFRQEGCNAAHGKFRGRWLAEHDVPLTLSLRSTKFELVPTNDNRIRVRTVPRGWLKRLLKPLWIFQRQTAALR